MVFQKHICQKETTIFLIFQIYSKPAECDSIDRDVAEELCNQEMGVPHPQNKITTF